MRISHTLEKALLTNSDTIATIFNQRQQTYSQLHSRVTKLASAFQKLGIADNDRIALLMLTSDYSVELFYGIPWAGGVVVPLNFRLAPPELVYLLNDSGSKVLVTDKTFAPLIPKLLPELESVEHVIYADAGETPEGMFNYEELIDDANSIDDAGRGNDDMLGIFYTGGTTGLPKGVMVTHDNMMYQVMMGGTYLPRNGIRWFTATPMFHVTGSIPVFDTVAWHGTHILRPAFDPVDTMKSIQTHKANVTVMVPTMVNMIVNHPALEDYDLSSMELIVYGGSPMPTAIIAKSQEQLPTTELLQAYGMTEVSGGLTFLENRDHDTSGKRVQSAGQALLGCEAKIVNLDGNEVPRKTIGEVIMTGPPVMKGYWNKPEETAKAVKNGWMHSGDAGYMDDDGYVYIVDRVKDMIISGGENVYSIEVENAIYQHPSVALCAVIGIPDDKWGEAIHAVISLKPDETVTSDAIIAHCRERIAGYKLPRSIEFRNTASMPLSGAGKILKHQIRSTFWEGKDRRVN